VNRGTHGFNNSNGRHGVGNDDRLLGLAGNDVDFLSHGYGNTLDRGDLGHGGGLIR
jgi:hypothetical protein